MDTGAARELRNRARETPRQFVERESHYLWDRRHLLTIVERSGKPFVKVDHRRITLYLPARYYFGKTRRIDLRVAQGVASSGHSAIDFQMANKAERDYCPILQTKWGSCNHRAGNIRINTELVKKPKNLLEYVIVHELVHLLEPTHSERFSLILDEHFPNWREARAELNELPPLSADVWKECRNISLSVH